MALNSFTNEIVKGANQTLLLKQIGEETPRRSKRPGHSLTAAAAEGLKHEHEDVDSSESKKRKSDMGQRK